MIQYAQNAIAHRVENNQPLIHLRWTTPEAPNNITQIYINRELVAVSEWPLQNELFLYYEEKNDLKFEVIHLNSKKIEHRYQNMKNYLNGWTQQYHKSRDYHLIRDEVFPAGTIIRLLNNESLVDRNELWRSTDHRGGFGSLFGEGLFGEDQATGIGLGRGQLGSGKLGVDGESLTLFTKLKTGSNLLQAMATDGNNNTLGSPIEIEDVLIREFPNPVINISISSDYALNWE